MTFSFQIVSGNEPAHHGSEARRGVLGLFHGTVETPVFMPVGTIGAVRTMTEQDLRDVGCQMMLSNTYHLLLRPGIDLIRHLGGLHRFIHWDRPILTDSGGYQVFSLATFRKLSEEGVLFRSPVDGQQIFLSPESAVETQEALGSDIMMVLDECTPYPCDREKTAVSMELSNRWAERCLRARKRRELALFGIVQGGMYPDLRHAAAAHLAEHPFDGLAIGGLSVGEPKELMFEILSETLRHMPHDKPRYLMGVGKPEDLVRAVGLGVDMFDCVIPTRNGRNGMVFTPRGAFNVKNSEFKERDGPIDETCGCYTCRTYSAAFLRHCFLMKEMLGPRLTTLHNVAYYINLMSQMREAISRGAFKEFSGEFFARYEIRPEADASAE